MFLDSAEIPYETSIKVLNLCVRKFLFDFCSLEHSHLSCTKIYQRAVYYIYEKKIKLFEFYF